MSTGRRHFQVREALIQPNGEIILEPPIPGDNRVETPARTPLRDRTNPQSRTLDPKTVVQPEPTAVSERAQEGEKGVLKTRPKELLDIALSETENLQPPCNVDIALSDIENSQRLWELEGTKEDPPEPTLTPDTYLLTSNAGKAIWT